MQEIVNLPLNFKPRDYQKAFYKAFLHDKIKNCFLVLPRRFGKDACMLNALVIKMLERVGNYYYVFPEIGQGRKAIWDAVNKEGKNFLDCFPPELIRKKNQTTMRLELTNGSSLQFVGASRYDYLVGSNPVGVVLSEYAIQTPLLLQFLQPVLAQNEGWILINTTPRGHNHAYKLFNKVKDDPRWFTMHLNCLEGFNLDGTRVITDQMLEDSKLVMSTEKIRQEYYCDWDVALENSYFSKHLRKAQEEGRIYDFPIDQTIPVHTCWDLGVDDPMSICFFQKMKNGVIKFVDYFEANNEGITYFINYLDDWKTKNGCIFGSHFAPHDVNQREQSTGVSRLETFKKLGIDFVRVPRPKNKQIDSIERTRIKFNTYEFHKTKCSYLLDCLMQYQSKVSINGVVTGPLHDWASHGADAFQLLALAMDNNLLDKHTGNFSTIGFNQAAHDYLLD